MTPSGPRLSDATLPPSSPRVRTPVGRPAQTGIVHLGAGAFFRAHQAVFTDQAMAVTGDDRWGILAVTGQRPDVAETLSPQDGLFSVLERSGEPDRVEVVGALTGAIAGGRDAQQAVAAIAAEETQVVTLTITEKAYAAGAPSRPLLTLREGLERRRRTHGRPITVVSCDNLRDNGAVLRTVLSATVGDDTRRWMHDAVAFPRTMVDRIVPATSTADLQRVHELLGVRDAAAVVAESFSQWVIADEFAGDRPAWEAAGAIIGDEVSQWEDLKIRTLNATHSLLAYEGALRGHRTIAECVADAELAGIARGLMRQTARSFEVPTDADLTAYQETTLERFANPGLGHTVAQIAKDGTEKLPVRLLAPLCELREQGADFELVARAVAAWMVVSLRLPDLIDDPRADAVRAAATGARDARTLVTSMLGLGEVFDARLSRDAVVVDVLAEQADQLMHLR